MFRMATVVCFWLSSVPQILSGRIGSYQMFRVLAATNNKPRGDIVICQKENARISDFVSNGMFDNLNLNMR